MPNSWMDKASCRGHPTLDPDSWFDIVNGSPKEQGAKALFVCRNVCPVMEECRAAAQTGVDTIVGGGWFDGRGKFREPEDELVDVHQAAAYLGVNTERVRRLMGRRLPVTDHRRGKAWFKVEDVMTFGRHLSPSHGTYEARQLHELKGEPLCKMCKASTMSACAS